MSKQKFNSLKDAYDYLEKHAIKIMQEIVDEEVIPTMLEVIDRVVYDAYTPTLYERRYERGGLADPTNIDVTLDKFDNKITASVKNIAQPNGDNASSPYYLDFYIVTGKGYTWDKSKIYQMEKELGAYPRDFYEETRKVMEKELPTIIANKFKQHGISVKFNVRVR